MASYKDLSIRTKLGICFSIAIWPLILLALIPLLRLGPINEKTQNIATLYIPMLQAANNVQSDMTETMNAFRLFSLNGDIANREVGMESYQSATENMNTLTELINSDKNISVGVVESYNQVKVLFDEISKLFNEIDAVSVQTFRETVIIDSVQNIYVNSLQHLLGEMKKAQKNAVVTKNITDMSSYSTGVEYITTILLANRLLNTREIFNDEQQRLKYVAIYDETNEKLSKLQVSSSALSAELAEINRLQKDLVQRKQNLSDKNASALKTIASLPQVGNEMHSAAMALCTHVEIWAGQSATSVNSTIRSVRIFGFISIVVIMILVTIVVQRQIGSIVRGIRLGISSTQKLAGGNLDVDFVRTEKATNDEFANLAMAMADMKDNLTNMVKSINVSASEISLSSGEMSRASNQMSQSANEQASSAEEVSSAIEEMASSIQQNSDNAGQTEQIVVSASQTITDCSKAANKTVSAMSEIAEKISIIDDIAFQTNILALNAAVEAARAGDHGKGFAVVAAEVRKLAEKCATAAKEIDVVSSDGVSLAKQTGEVFSKVLPEIERIVHLVQEIAASSREQSSGSEQINTAVQRFNMTTQQFVSIAEEMATNSEMLASQAEKLVELMKYFKLS